MLRKFINFQYAPQEGVAGGNQTAEAPLTAGAAGANQASNQAAAGTMVNRAPNYQLISINEVRPYVRNGKTMFAFNQGAFHLSYRQLEAAGILMPELLQGTEMLIDFFQVGETLLNGSEVRDANRIIRGFIPEQDKTLLREVAVDLYKQRVQSWKSNLVQTTNNQTASRSTGTMGASSGAPLNASATGQPYQQGASPLSDTQQNQAGLGQRDFSNSAGGANTGTQQSAATQDNTNLGNQGTGTPTAGDTLVNEP
jgi:hypothetical protein